MFMADTIIISYNRADFKTFAQIKRVMMHKVSPFSDTKNTCHRLAMANFIKFSENLLIFLDMFAIIYTSSRVTA